MFYRSYNVTKFGRLRNGSLHKIQSQLQHIYTVIKTTTLHITEMKAKTMLFISFNFISCQKAHSGSQNQKGRTTEHKQHSVTEDLYIALKSRNFEKNELLLSHIKSIFYSTIRLLHILTVKQGTKWFKKLLLK